MGETALPKYYLLPSIFFCLLAIRYSNKLCKHGDSCWSVICPFRHPERENGGRGTAPNEKTKAVPPWKTKECWNWINKVRST